MKHNSTDIVTEDIKVTIHCSFNKDGETVAKDNLNFTLTEAKYQDICKALGVETLNEKTPLMVILNRPEGKALEEWAEQTQEPDPQGTLPEDE